MDNNKKIWLWVLGAVVVVVLIVLFISMQSSNTSTTPTSNETQNETQGVSSTGVSGVNNVSGSSATKAPSSAMQTNALSLKQLLSSGKTQMCTFVDTSSGTNIQGTMYISGGKIRGDLNVTTSGKTTGTHMVVIGQDVYVWADGMTAGFKSSFAMTSQPTSNPNSNGLNADKEMDYRCNPWTVDNSRFVLPTSVKFTSISTTGASTQ